MSSIDSIRRSQFSTADLPPEQRFSAWRDTIGTLYDVQPHAGQSSSAFEATLDNLLINGQLMLTHCTTRAQRFTRSAFRAAADGLDHYLLQIHISGEQQVKRGKQHATIKPGGLLVIDLAEKHEALSTDFNNISLIIPRPLLAPLLDQPDGQQGRVLPADNPLVALAVNHLTTLVRVADALDEADAQTLVLPTLQLMAGSLNGSPDSVPAGDRAVYGSLLLQARLYITSRLHESISVDKLCGHLNCSPATLSRVFKRHNGVRAYIQEQRLRMAARRLVSQRDAHLRISDIACECGFSSDAHFSRAFRQRFGLSPSDARNLGAVPPTKRPGFGQGTTSEPREYERWVMESLT